MAGHHSKFLVTRIAEYTKYLAILEVPVEAESVANQFASCWLTKVGTQMVANNVSDQVGVRKGAIFRDGNFKDKSQCTCMEKYFGHGITTIYPPEVEQGSSRYHSPMKGTSTERVQRCVSL